MRKGKDMNLESKEVLMNGSDYIELESVGTAVYANGMTYSINVDGTHDTYELSGVHILDTDDEWWYSLSMEDALLLFPFLAEISDVFNSENYMAWAVQRFQIVEEASGEYVNFEDSWVYSNTLGDA